MAGTSFGKWGRCGALGSAFAFPVASPDGPRLPALQVFGGSRPSGDDNKQLAQLNFQTGDFLSVAIFT